MPEKPVMKRLHPSLSVFTSVLIALLCAGCMKDKIMKKYTVYQPVMKHKMEVLAEIRNEAPQTLKSPGKIFMYGSYLYINEINEGVHVIDNTDPKAPKAIAFIPIPGSLDIAVKGNTLYADMYSDLIVVDISNPLNTRFLRNFTHVFPERNYGSSWRQDSTMVVVDWIIKDTMVTVEDSPGLWDNCRNCVAELAFANISAPGKASTPVPGIAGSMSRFAIVNEILYTVNSSTLGVFDITNPEEPEQKGTYSPGWGIETIYPFKDKLFLGSTSGMFIYNIANPEVPVREGSFSHALACDPVVADDDYAYVTLRSGNTCGGFSNQLDILDVSDITNPTLVKTYPMSNPHGLAKDGDVLFICDGEDGLRIFDATNVDELKLLQHIDDVDSYDVIAWNNRLLMIGSDGLFQYDYTNPSQTKLLSVLNTSVSK